MSQKPTIDTVVQEVIDIVSQKKFNAGMELLEMRFMIGEAVIASPYWQKATRGELLAAVEESTGLGERSIRYCAEFKEKYGTWKNVLENADPDHKLPAWREIIKSLPSARKELTEPSETRCKKCEIHCQ